MRNVTIVVLARYADIFDGFRRGIDEFEPEARKILVKDGENVFPALSEKWTVIQAPSPFNFSRNVNLGWQAAGDDDVLHCGDDVRFSSPVISKLREVAYSDPTIAVAVPELGGQSPFAIGLFKREMIDAVGWMDEEYTGYGVDDNDYCHRFGIAGWRTQPTTEVSVQHSAASTYYRRQAEGAVNMGESCEQNWKRFNQKWGKPAEGPERWLKEGRVLKEIWLVEGNLFDSTWVPIGYQRLNMTKEEAERSAEIDNERHAPGKFRAIKYVRQE